MYDSIFNSQGSFLWFPAHCHFFVSQEQLVHLIISFRVCQPLFSFSFSHFHEIFLSARKMRQHFRFSQGPFQTMGFKGETLWFPWFFRLFSPPDQRREDYNITPRAKCQQLFHIFYIFYIFCNSSLLRWIRQVFILVCREHPDSKVSFKLSVHGITHLLRLLQRKLQINPFF